MDSAKSFFNSFSTATPPSAVTIVPGNVASAVTVKKSTGPSPLAIAGIGAAVVASALLVKKLFFANGLGAMSRSLFVSHRKEEEVLKYVITHAKEGDVDSVISTIDQYCYDGHWMMNVGDVKGEIVDAELKKKQPKVAVELGAYCGYSALRIARQLPANGHLYSIEIDALNAAIATKIIEFAGLKNKVTFVIGTVSTRTAYLKETLKIKNIDFLFIDHLKTEYKPDFLRLEEAGLLSQSGSVIVADNCLFPGCPDYVEMISTHPSYNSVRHESTLEYCDKKDHVWVSVRK